MTDTTDTTDSLLLERPNPHAAYGFAGARLLQAVDSPFQRVEIWDTPQLGRVLRLDGRFMTSVADEFIYHECMVHPAALTHPRPRRALVLGGGDGGAARQLLKHPQIERIVIAELDAQVVAAARRHLEQVHRGALDDPRVELRITDAAHFVEQAHAQTHEHAHERFDLVVFDLTPPDSPAAALFTGSFYERLKQIMTADALLSMHLGSPVFNAQAVCALSAGLRAHFRHVDIMTAYVPLYGSLWAMAVAGNVRRPARVSNRVIGFRLARRGITDLCYYHGGLHAALFTWPRYLRAVLA